MTDIVEKVFSGWRPKIPRAADASDARRREGPNRFIQNRSRTSVVALSNVHGISSASRQFATELARSFPNGEIFRVVQFALIAPNLGRDAFSGCEKNGGNLWLSTALGFQCQVATYG